MERMVFRWLTGAGVMAALFTVATDTWGTDWLPGPSIQTARPITVLVVERNGAKLIPYVVCTVPVEGQ